MLDKQACSRSMGGTSSEEMWQLQTSAVIEWAAGMCFRGWHKLLLSAGSTPFCCEGGEKQTLTHVETNLGSRQNNDIKLHANNTAKTATCHLQQTAPKRRMSTLILDQGITAQRNKVACKQQGNHMVMQQEGTSNKHQGLQRRATSSCCYDITLRQPLDRQTDR